MSLEVKFERVEDPDDPNRCEGYSAHGQCPFKRIPPGKYCLRCGHGSPQQQEEKEAVRNYHLTKYRGRINEFADSSQVKSLREEIGILRLQLETILERCKDEDDIILYSNKMSELVLKIEKLVTSCHKLEVTSGQLLDRNKALNFATQLVSIISEEIDDASAIEKISSRVLIALGSLQNLSVDE